MKKIHRKNSLSKIGLIASLVVTVIAGSVLILVHAAGGDTLTLTSSSTTYNIGDTIPVTIHENSTDTINVAQADLIYDQSKLQFLNIDQSNSTFDVPAHATGGNGAVSVARGISNGGTVTGAQTVATVNFKVLAGSGTTDITFAASSIIFNPTLQPPADSNVWDRNPIGITYTLTTPAQTCPSGQTGTPPNCVTPTCPSGQTGTPPNCVTPSGGGGGSSGGGTGSTTKSSGNGSSGASSSPSASQQAANPATPVPVTNTGSVANAGYIVNIKITDSSGKLLGGAKVTLDNKTVTSDKTGIASFVNVSSGTHTVTVTSGGSTTKVVVLVDSQKASTLVQQFSVKLKHKSALPIAIEISVAVIIVAIAGFMVWRRKLLTRFAPHHSSESVAGVTSATVVSPAADSSAEMPNDSPVDHSEGDTPTAEHASETPIQPQVVTPTDPAPSTDEPTHTPEKSQF